MFFAMIKQEVFSVARCPRCGKYHSRPVNVTIEKMPEPIQCDCGAKVVFTGFKVHHKIIGKKGSLVKRLLNVPPETISDIKTFVVAALSLEAAGILYHYRTALTHTENLVIAGVSSLFVIVVWLLGREWLKASLRNDKR